MIVHHLILSLAFRFDQVWCSCTRGHSRMVALSGCGEWHDHIWFTQLDLVRAGCDISELVMSLPGDELGRCGAPLPPEYDQQV